MQVNKWNKHLSEYTKTNDLLYLFQEEETIAQCIADLKVLQAKV